MNPFELHWSLWAFAIWVSVTLASSLALLERWYDGRSR